MSVFWLALAAFVGVNLVQSVFTGFCPAEIIIERLKAWKSPPGPDADSGL